MANKNEESLKLIEDLVDEHDTARIKTAMEKDASLAGSISRLLRAVGRERDEFRKDNVEDPEVTNMREVVERGKGWNYVSNTTDEDIVHSCYSVGLLSLVNIEVFIINEPEYATSKFQARANAIAHILAEKYGLPVDPEALKEFKELAGDYGVTQHSVFNLLESGCTMIKDVYGDRDYTKSPGLWVALK